MANVHLQAGHFPNTTTLYVWHFKETSDGATIPAEVGGIALDRIGALTQQNNHLATPENVFCEFDGTNDYAKSTNAAFAFTGSFSIATWIYRANWATNFASAGESFIAKIDANVNGWRLAGNGDNTNLRLIMRSSDLTVHDVIVAASGLSAGWHHVVVTINKNTESRFYIDNGSPTITSDTDMNYGTAGNLNIGAYNDGAAPLNGRVQDVAIHDGTVWSASEVATIYNAAALAGPAGLFFGCEW